MVTTPICKQIPAFDSNVEQVFSFISSGGNVVCGNKLNIYDSNNKIIYSNSVGTAISTNTSPYYQLNQTLPSGTLSNGNSYYFTFTSYDSNGESSNESSKLLFYCFSEPKIIITNIPKTHEIGSATYNFIGEYNQKENEPCSYIYMKLYNNATGQLIETSKNIYMTDKTDFSYTFNNMENHGSYKIVCTGLTKYNTEIVSEDYVFMVSYYNPVLYSILSLENKNREGYVQISNDVILVDGTSNTKDLDYTDKGLSLITKDDFVYWDKGYSITSTFCLNLDFYCANLNSTFLQLSNQDNNYVLNFELVREIPYGETIVKDYVRIFDNKNKILLKSNNIDITNSNTLLHLKFYKSSNDYIIELEAKERTETILQWNNDSNVYYDMYTDLSYENESYKNGEQFNEVKENIEEFFPFNFTKVSNGIYRFIDISKNNTDTKEWTYDTILNCDFNNNISGGNINVTINQINYIKLIRKGINETKWTTIFENVVSSLEDVNFIYYDKLVPSEEELVYAIIPILNGGEEGNMITSNIKTCFDGIFISDNEHIFKLYNGVSYSNGSLNTNVGIYNTLNSKYPIVIRNGSMKYLGLNISGDLYGYSFEKTRKINRKDVIQQSNDLCEFLSNGKVKFIKDWNGNSWLCQILDDISIDYNQAYSNGIQRISFSIVEQGKWNNQEDLYKNGLLNI